MSMNPTALTPKRIIGGAITLLLLLTLTCVATHGPLLAKGKALGTGSTAPVHPAVLRVKLSGSRVTLFGVLPDESTRRRLVTGATKAFGEKQVIDQLKIDPEVSHPEWQETVSRLFPLVKGRLNEGELELKERTIVVRGEIQSEEAKTQFLRKVFAATGAELTVNDQLVVSIEIPITSPAASGLQQRINDEMRGKSIEFSSATSDIKPHSKKLLDSIAGVLKSEPEIRVEIEGHTDSKGDEKRNMKLSEQRAEAVQKYLVGRGIAATRLVATGRGATKPIADDTTELGQRQNRRIELRVLE
jgi:OmpA-OmpF porin, OOP family